MPIQRATHGSKPGYRYGRSGKVYTYKRGSAASRRKAKQKAAKQGLAIQHRTGHAADF